MYMIGHMKAAEASKHSRLMRRFWERQPIPTTALIMRGLSAEAMYIDLYATHSFSSDEMDLALLQLSCSAAVV